MPARAPIGPALAALLTVALATTAPAQETPKTKAAPPAGAARPTAPAPAPAPVPSVAPLRKPGNAGQVLATVNGEPITRGEVEGVLAGFQVPAGDEEQYYKAAVDMLVNSHLLAQFLTREAKVTVSPSEVDEAVAQEEKRLKQNNLDLPTALANVGSSMESYRDRIARTLQWKKYLLAKGKEAELRSYLEKNKEAFDGTLVAARHILLKVDPDASQAEKDKARQRLAEIKQEIASGKISFPDAANKYSEDPGNVATPSGGDLGYFPRRGQFIEPFTKAAFALKKDQISDPVETEYGYHLIQVTDRREGKPIDFAQNRDRILNEYAADLQADIVSRMRQSAKIDVKPMPADLFPKALVAPAAPATDTPNPGQPKPSPSPDAATPKGGS